MIPVPAIDILDGKAVRLKRGDYAQVTVYNEDPVAQAAEFEAQGAEAIHIVDLDGARDGAPTNIECISRIVSDTGIRTVEVGGGIRDMATVERYAAAGVDRIVLGSALIKDRDFALEAAREFGSLLVAGIDAKDGMVAVEGWLEASEVSAAALVAELKDMGYSHLVYTDIARDGMRSGIDAEAYGDIARAAGFAVTASGGIATLADLEALARIGEPGIDGAITGRAIYEGEFTVAEAVALCKEVSAC